MDANSLTRSRPSSIEEILRQRQEEHQAEPPPPVVPRPEEHDADLSDPLPKASDEYAAFGRVGNKPLLSLYFMLKDGSFDGFAYANLERIRLMPAGETGGGNELLLRFAGSAVTEVRLKGRNLAPLHAYLGQHRTPWVRELPPQRDFRASSLPVITGIAIKEV